MTEEHRKENIAAIVRRAEQESRLADLACREQLYHAAISHAYYAAFHYAVGLLLVQGLQARTHGGVAHLVNIHYVRQGLLSPRMLQVLGHLQKDREIADYDAMASYDEATALDAMRDARQFGEACRALIASAGYLTAT